MWDVWRFFWMLVIVLYFWRQDNLVWKSMISTFFYRRLFYDGLLQWSFYNGSFPTVFFNDLFLTGLVHRVFFNDSISTGFFSEWPSGASSFSIYGSSSFSTNSSSSFSINGSSFFSTNSSSYFSSNCSFSTATSYDSL